MELLDEISALLRLIISFFVSIVLVDETYLMGLAVKSCNELYFWVSMMGETGSFCLTSVNIVVILVLY